MVELDPQQIDFVEENSKVEEEIEATTTVKKIILPLENQEDAADTQIPKPLEPLVSPK